MGQRILEPGVELFLVFWKTRWSFEIDFVEVLVFELTFVKPILARVSTFGIARGLVEGAKYRNRPNHLLLSHT